MVSKRLPSQLGPVTLSVVTGPTDRVIVKKPFTYIAFTYIDDCFSDEAFVVQHNINLCPIYLYNLGTDTC